MFGFCFDRLHLVWQVVWCLLSKQCSCQNSQNGTRVALGRRLRLFLVSFLKNLNLSSMLSCFKVSVSTSTWSSTLRLKELTVSVIFLENLFSLSCIWCQRCWCSSAPCWGLKRWKAYSLPEVYRKREIENVETEIYSSCSENQHICNTLSLLPFPQLVFQCSLLLI